MIFYWFILASDKKGSLSGVFGRKKKNNSPLTLDGHDDSVSTISYVPSTTNCGYFCGNISKIYFTEGTWETWEKQIYEAYLAGVSSPKNLKQIGIEAKEIFVLDPVDYCKEVADGTTGSLNEREFSPSDNSFFKTKDPIDLSILDGGCCAHSVKGIRDTIRLSTPQAFNTNFSLAPFFPFLLTHPLQRLEALNIIITLIKTSQKNKK